MTDYLKAQKGSDLFNTVFQLANVHLEFHDNAVSMYHQVGEKKYHEKPFVLSEAQLHDTSACVTYICDNILKTVFLKYNDEKQEAVEKRYIVGGRLHVMMKRNGVACERVYERIVQPRRGWFW